MVNVNCTGGGGYFSDDVSATKAQVVKGKQTVTKDSNDEVIEGTMTEVGAADAQKSNSVASSNLYLRMTNGAHRTKNQTSGFPEVYIPLQTLRSQIGATDASKILVGTTIAGLAGTMPNRGAWNSTLALSGSVVIPQGWHNGNGKISRPYSTYGGGTWSPSASNQTIPTAGKIITGDIKCKADANLIANNIKHGVSLFGITGQVNGVTHVAYDGSNFYGALKNGVLTGFDFYFQYGGAGGAYVRRIGAVDGHNIGDTITSGELKVDRLFTGNSSSSFEAGLMTAEKIDFTPFNQISISQTGQWRVFYAGSSDGNQLYYLNIANPTLCTYNSERNRYEPILDASQFNIKSTIPELSYSGTKPGLSAGSGYHTTSWTVNYDISQVTGSYYLFFGYGHHGDLTLTNSQLSDSITQISFII